MKATQETAVEGSSSKENITDSEEGRSHALFEEKAKGVAREALKTKLPTYAQACTQACLSNHAEELEGMARWLLSMQKQKNTNVKFDISGIEVEIKVASVEPKEDEGIIILSVARHSKVGLKMAKGTQLKLQYHDSPDLKDAIYFGDLNVSDAFPFYFMLFLLGKEE